MKEREKELSAEELDAVNGGAIAMPKVAEDKKVILTEQNDKKCLICGSPMKGTECTNPGCVLSNY